MAHPPGGSLEFSDFSEWDANAYNDHHYGTVQQPDELVYGGVIEGLGNMAAAGLIDFGTGESFFEPGSSAAFKTISLIAPFLGPGATVRITDVAPPQIEAINQGIQDVRVGRPGKWASHEASMVRVDKRWGGGLARVFNGGAILVEQHNIIEQPAGPARFRIEAHTLCSITDKEQEYWQVEGNYLEGMEPGDAAVRINDVESREYWVNGERFPGYPINQDMVTQGARRRGLEVITAFSVPPPNVFGTSTASTFTGLCAAVLYKPRTTTVIS